MNLPNSHLALVEREKLVDYLLNAAHPDNGGKAAFFLGRGFTPEAWPRLAQSLATVAASFPVVKNVASAHGHKYIVDGELAAPDGNKARVRTVWIVDAGQTTPRLVTAYPWKD